VVGANQRAAELSGWVAMGCFPGPREVAGANNGRTPSSFRFRRSAGLLRLPGPGRPVEPQRHRDGRPVSALGTARASFRRQYFEPRRGVALPVLLEMEAEREPAYPGCG